MTACCTGSCEGTDRFFSRFSHRYEKSFRKKGLEKIQRLLLDGVRRSRNGSSTILDIGCGVGALHLTLLREGWTQAVGVDVSEAMITSARTLSQEMGFAEKTRYIYGDFVIHAENIDDHDITLLDKVVCCYEDLDTLLRHSLEKTRSMYALTYPRNNRFVKMGYWIQVFISKLFRSPFRPFWHDWNAMRQHIRNQGFELVSHDATLFWQAVVFRRPSSTVKQGTK